MLYLPYAALLASVASAASVPEVESHHYKVDFSVWKGDSRSTATRGGQAKIATAEDFGYLYLANAQNYYSATLKIGSNGDENNLLVDTGSSDLWVMSRNVLCAVHQHSQKRDSFIEFVDHRIVDYGDEAITPANNNGKRSKYDNYAQSDASDGPPSAGPSTETSSTDTDAPSATETTGVISTVESSVSASATGPTSGPTGPSIVPSGTEEGGGSMTDTESYTNGKFTNTASPDNTACLSYGSFSTGGSQSFNTNWTAPDFSIQYGDGTYATGIWGTDFVSVGDLNVSLSLGVVKQTSSQFGVFGIGLPGLEVTSAYADPSTAYTYENFPIRLKSAGRIKKVAYSLYLNEPHAASGSILFGAVDHAKYSGQLQTVPLLNMYPGHFAKPISFDVALDLVTLGDSTQNITISNYTVPALLDSGTTLTYLPFPYLNAIAKSLNGTSSSVGFYQVSCDYNTSSAFITYGFSGVQIQAPLSDLILSDGSGKCYLGIGGTSQDQPEAILGDSFLRHAYVVYNLEDYEISLAPVKYTDDEDLEVISSTIPSAVQAPGYFSTALVDHIPDYTDSAVILTLPTHSTTSVVSSAPAVVTSTPASSSTVFPAYSTSVRYWNSSISSVGPASSNSASTSSNTYYFTETDTTSTGASSGTTIITSTSTGPNGAVTTLTTTSTGTTSTGTTSTSTTSTGSAAGSTTTGVTGTTVNTFTSTGSNGAVTTYTSTSTGASGTTSTGTSSGAIAGGSVAGSTSTGAGAGTSSAGVSTGASSATTLATLTSTGTNGVVTTYTTTSTGGGAGTTGTVTNIVGTTIITITSCSNHKCTTTAVPATQGPTTVTTNGETTIYTTWCPITAASAASAATTSAAVISSGAAAGTSVGTVTSTGANGAVTTYTTVAGAASTGTVTDIVATTIITITSCSDHKCTKTAVPATQGPTTVTTNGETTVYTTWCPLTATAATPSPVTVTLSGDNGVVTTYTTTAGVAPGTVSTGATAGTTVITSTTTGANGVVTTYTTTSTGAVGGTTSAGVVGGTTSTGANVGTASSGDVNSTVFVTITKTDAHGSKTTYTTAVPVNPTGVPAGSAGTYTAIVSSSVAAQYTQASSVASTAIPAVSTAFNGAGKVGASLAMLALPIAYFL
ncbi:hypothetical protein JCM33374_g5176 [Metschnikowia sp. JCM 33374]|nr:hypothetical protein JCM33374_g5176 [Metschnikowia sp. JCM 33374]